MFKETHLTEERVPDVRISIGESKLDLLLRGRFTENQKTIEHTSVVLSGLHNDYERRLDSEQMVWVFGGAK